jgi:hypothetical protein
MPRPSSHGALAVAIAGLGVLLLLGGWKVVQDVSGLREEGSDFLYYWLGAHAIAEGTPLYPWLGGARTFDEVGYVNPYPPLIGIALAPLAAMFDYYTARWLWLAASAGCLALAAVLTWRASGLSRQWRSIWAWVPAFALLPWALISLAIGQFSAVLFLLISVAFSAYLQGRWRWAGGSIGLGAALKLTPALLLVYWGLRREWLPLTTGLALGGSLGVLSLLIVGPGAYVDYFTQVVPVFRSIDAIPGNVSLVGFWSKLLIPNPYTEPIIALPWAGPSLIVASTVGVLVGTAYAVVCVPQDAEGMRRSYALTVAAMLLVTPMNGAYNLVIAAVPLTVATAVCNERGGRTQAVIAVLTLLLMCPIGSSAPSLGLDMLWWRGGWGLVLAQGTIVGLLGLWALLWCFCRELHGLRAASSQFEQQPESRAAIRGPEPAP